MVIEVAELELIVLPTTRADVLAANQETGRRMSEPSKPTADPMISITLPPITLRLGVALITAAALLIIGGLGVASSPMVDGHPVVLSPKRLAIKTYLDNANGWLQRFTEIEQQLATAFDRWADLEARATALKANGPA